jgi:NAD(P)H dehydrogenase (quinone)
MIVVTGAGGRLGGAVVAALLERMPAQEIGVSTTAPEKLSALTEAGVRVRRGDYDDAATLRDAFEGADRVLLVSAPRIGDGAVAAHRAAISAAAAAGVGRLLYTSHIGADALSPFPPATTHAATEVLLTGSGIPFTALRNGFYADTPVRLLQGAAASGELRVPADAPVSWTTHEDLAPAIAALLLDPALEEPVVNLTAGEAFDLAELVEVASGTLGHDIRHVVLSDDEYRDELLATGAPEMAAVMTLGIFLAARQRRLGIVDPALARLIGRPATDLRGVIAERLTH